MKRIFYIITRIFIASIFLSLGFLMPLKAAEYTITDMQDILYTNDKTCFFSEADENTMILSSDDIDENIPILVIGITNNNYYQVEINNEILYIQKDGLSDNRQQEVYNIIMAQKSVFPEGMHWTNDDYYEWNGGIYVGGFGCAAFCFYVSDKAFGNAKAYIHKDYSNIKVGDMLRVYNDTHSVTVLEVRENSVIVAEGNYNSSIHWGREMSMSEIIDSQSYIMSRY
jgi:hypothetical protein